MYEELLVTSPSSPSLVAPHPFPEQAHPPARTNTTTRKRPCTLPHRLHGPARSAHSGCTVQRAPARTRPAFVTLLGSSGLLPSAHGAAGVSSVRRVAVLFVSLLARTRRRSLLGPAPHRCKRGAKPHAGDASPCVLRHGRAHPPAAGACVPGRHRLSGTLASVRCCCSACSDSLERRRCVPRQVRHWPGRATATPGSG